MFENLKRSDYEPQIALIRLYYLITAHGCILNEFNQVDSGLNRLIPMVTSQAPSPNKVCETANVNPCLNNEMKKAIGKTKIAGVNIIPIVLGKRKIPTRRRPASQRNCVQ